VCVVLVCVVCVGVGMWGLLPVGKRATQYYNSTVIKGGAAGCALLPVYDAIVSFTIVTNLNNKSLHIKYSLYIHNILS
jgi:hypothetical protein